MTRGSSRFALIVIAAIAALAPAADPITAAGPVRVTIADLALQLTRSAGIPLPVHESAQAAVASLSKAGIHLGTDLKAPVTEKLLVQVGLGLGVRVSTSHPEAAVTPAVSSAFIQAFKGELQSAATVAGQSGADMTHASCQGRMSREARQGAPASASSFNASAGPCEEPVP